MEKTKIFVISSTHWDREWYETFEQFRFRLVRMIDNLIETMEQDENFKFFHFDGQSIVIKDYLLVRPKMKERLEKLIKNGRIEIAPWYTMPDEFLVNGESLIRNLELGHNICESYGVNSSVNGYLCDSFGHNSQIPQIFKSFNIDNTAFVRGLNKITTDRSIWEGADGSKIIAYTFDPDYTYGSFFFTARWCFENKEIDYDILARRMEKYLEEEKSKFVGNIHLMMDGVDHSDSNSFTPKMIDELNKRLANYEFIHSNFTQFRQEVFSCDAQLNTISGNVYDVAFDGINNALLKNVLSSLVILKQANDRCETKLALIVEPLDLFISSSNGAVKDYSKDFPTAQNKQDFFNIAWELLAQNEAHDSICGCSYSAVHEDNINRFSHIEQIADVVVKDELLTLAQNVSFDRAKYDGAILIYNSSQITFNGYTTLKINMPCEDENIRVFDSLGNELEYNIINRDYIIDKVSKYNQIIKLPKIKAIFLVVKVAVSSFGYTTINYKILKNIRDDKNYEWKFSEYYSPKRNLGSMFINHNVIDNEKLIIKIQDNGLLDVTNKQTKQTFVSQLLFEDSADMGEGWNYSFPINGKISYSNHASFKILTDTKNCSKLEITVNMMTANDEIMTIVNILTIYRDDYKIEIVTKIDNRAKNHRLRVLFPTHLNVKNFYTSTPFDMSKWDITPKDNTFDKELDTLVKPNSGVIYLSDNDNSIAIYNKGLYEVAVCDNEEKAICLTLFRAFPQEVGQLKSEIGQMQREINLEYCVDYGCQKLSRAMFSSNFFKTQLHSVNIEKSDNILPQQLSFMSITGNAVVSSIRLKENKKLIRIYDIDSGCCGEITLTKKVVTAVKVDNLDNELEKLEIKNGKILYSLKSKEICLIKFEFEKE